MARKAKTQATTRRRVRSAPVSAAHAPTIGPGRYTVARFLSDASDASYAWLRGQWGDGNQLFARKVPVDVLPAVVIMSGYCRLYEIELVDDFDVLLERFQENIADCAHHDKFFASCIAILHERGLFPDLEGYESINIPAIYEEIFE